MWQISMDRSKESVSDPIGFRAPNAKVEETAPRKSNIEDLKMKRANEAANRPFQALFMTMLMLFIVAHVLLSSLRFDRV